MNQPSKKKKRLSARWQQFLAENRESIESEKLIILFVDECHLLWGDICEQVWGKASTRIEIPIKNEKQRPSYYGAINYYTGKVILQKYPQGNTEKTIKFIKYLKANSERKLVIIWDGASYHYSQEFRQYLEKVNQGKLEKDWSIKWIELAPNAPEHMRSGTHRASDILQEHQARRCVVKRERDVKEVLESL